MARAPALITIRQRTQTIKKPTSFGRVAKDKDDDGEEEEEEDPAPKKQKISSKVR